MHVSNEHENETYSEYFDLQNPRLSFEQNTRFLQNQFTQLVGKSAMSKLMISTAEKSICLREASIANTDDLRQCAALSEGCKATIAGDFPAIERRGREAREVRRECLPVTA